MNCGKNAFLFFFCYLFCGILCRSTYLETTRSSEFANIDQCVGEEDAAGILSLRCEGITEQRQLLEIANSVKGRRLRTFDLDSVHMDALPLQMFEEMHVEALRLNRSSFTRGLFDLSLGGNLGKDLQELSLESIQFPGDLPFNELRSLEALQSLYLHDVQVPRLGRDFRNNVAAGIRFLGVGKTRTSVVESGSLSSLNLLLYLSITDTLISQIPRDALPPFLPNLRIIFLSKNRLTSLPPNLFEGMPVLETLALNGNLLTTLEQKTFVPVWNHLQHLVVNENPLVCNCSIWWLVMERKTKNQKRTLATCLDITDNRLRDLNDLTELDQFCTV